MNKSVRFLEDRIGIWDNKYYEKLSATVKYLDAKDWRTRSKAYLYLPYLILICLIFVYNPIMAVLLLAFQLNMILYNAAKMDSANMLNFREFDLLDEIPLDRRKLYAPREEEDTGSIFLPVFPILILSGIFLSFLSQLPVIGYLISGILIPIVLLERETSSYLYKRRLLSQIDPSIRSIMEPLDMVSLDDPYQYVREYLRGATSCKEDRSGFGRIIANIKGRGIGKRYLDDTAIDRLMLTNEELGNHYSLLREMYLGIQPDAEVSEWNLPGKPRYLSIGEGISDAEAWNDLLVPFKENWRNFNDLGNLVFKYRLCETDYLKRRLVKRRGWDHLYLSGIDANFPDPYGIPQCKYVLALEEYLYSFMYSKRPQDAFLTDQVRIFVTWNTMVHWDYDNALLRGEYPGEEYAVRLYRGIDRYMIVYLIAFHVLATLIVFLA